LPNREISLPVKLRGLEICLPVETWSAHLKVVTRPAVVAFQDILGIHAHPMHGRDAMLQIKNTRRFGIRVGYMRKRQDGCDVRVILAADGGHARRGVEVVIAVWHTEAALQQIRSIAAGVI
jgi:hypothetical protein